MALQCLVDSAPLIVVVQPQGDQTAFCLLGIEQILQSKLHERQGARCTFHVVDDLGNQVRVDLQAHAQGRLCNRANHLLRSHGADLDELLTEHRIELRIAGTVREEI